MTLAARWAELVAEQAALREKQAHHRAVAERLLSDARAAADVPLFNVGSGRKRLKRLWAPEPAPRLPLPSFASRHMPMQQAPRQALMAPRARPSSPVAAAPRSHGARCQRA